MESIHKSIKELGLDKKEISFVCYGDVIKLRHKNTGKRLHSHPLNYNTGSKQQEVTGFDGNDDNDWWVVHGPHKDGDRENCKKAKAVKPGDIIRLEHLKTGKNLHSHGNFNSPSTNQQEVTCYGDSGVGDGNDNWKLEFKETKKLKWKPNMAITLTHVNTGAKLHSHSGQQTKVSHQQEVTGYKVGDSNDDWALDIIRMEDRISLLTSQLGKYKICYGDVIKLRHKNTAKRLHSHPINYNTGSKQQEVTCFDGSDDNDWWIIHGPHKDGERENCKKGKIVKVGDMIRLEHIKTGRNLHSHGNFNSPTTNQQEVTCYGNSGIGDGNDNWKIEFKDSNKKPWKGENTITLTHVNTGAKLHSHSGNQTKVSHQQEVTGYKGGDANDDWVLDALI